MPKADDAKHSLTEQEAKGSMSAESYACKNNVHEISLWPRPQQAEQALWHRW